MQINMEKVLKSIEENNIIAIRFEQTDLNGMARSKIIPACHFEEAATKGLNYPACVLGMDVQAVIFKGSGLGEEIGYQDGVIIPDIDTFRVLPWVKQTGRVLVEMTDHNGEVIESHSRVVARRQLEKLKNLGITLLSAHEHEFYLVDKSTMKTVNEDFNYNATIRFTPVNEFILQLMTNLPKVGVAVEHVETEYGPGQFEITYKPAFGIRAPDNAHTYKISIKEIALLNGYVASFMSKPYPDQSGSSSHFCHSLWDVDGKVPLIYDADDPTKLSKVAKHWIAGLVAHGPAITLLMGPTVNCLKRLKEPAFCPNHSTWGVDNRSVAFRVKFKGDKGTYFENRIGAAGCNPYLSLAATVAAGIDGIVNELELPLPVTGSAYDHDELPPNTRPLPTEMEDALQALLDDKVICDALGEEFIKCFTAGKKNDIEIAKKALARGDKDWEFKYFFYYL